MFAILLVVCGGAGDVSNLGESSFTVRAAAQRRIEASILSIPAVIRGLSSTDPEVRLRCEKAVNTYIDRWNDNLRRLAEDAGYYQEEYSHHWWHKKEEGDNRVFSYEHPETDLWVPLLKRMGV